MVTKTKAQKQPQQRPQQADPKTYEQPQQPPQQVTTNQIVSAQPSLAVLEKSQMEILVDLAHAHKRSLTEFHRKATEMITQDEQTALSCIYKRPVGKDEENSDRQKMVEGQSIRLAEIVYASYGNIFISDVDIEVAERYVKAIAFGVDLETLAVVRRVCIESTIMKNGMPYSERQRVITGKAASAKARRDVTFSVVPKSMCNQLYQIARDVAFGKGNVMTMQKRRENILAWADKLGIEKERLFAAIKIKGINDIGLDEIETLYGLKTAIQDGDTTIDEAFPPLNFDEKKDISQGTINQNMGQEKMADAFDKGKKTTNPAPATDVLADDDIKKPEQPKQAPPATPQIDPKGKYRCEYCSQREKREVILPGNEVEINEQGVIVCGSCGYDVVKIQE